MKTKLKKGQIFELMGGNTRYKILKIWDGYEAGNKSRPVVWGQIHRIGKTGTLIKSEKPLNRILEFHYGGSPLMNGKICK